MNKNKTNGSLLVVDEVFLLTEKVFSWKKNPKTESNKEITFELAFRQVSRGRTSATINPKYF